MNKRVLAALAVAGWLMAAAAVWDSEGFAIFLGVSGVCLSFFSLMLIAYQTEQKYKRQEKDLQKWYVF